MFDQYFELVNRIVKTKNKNSIRALVIVGQLVNDPLLINGYVTTRNNATPKRTQTIKN